MPISSEIGMTPPAAAGRHPGPPDQIRQVGFDDQLDRQTAMGCAEQTVFQHRFQQRVERVVIPDWATDRPSRRAAAATTLGWIDTGRTATRVLWVLFIPGCATRPTSSQIGLPVNRIERAGEL